MFLVCKYINHFDFHPFDTGIFKAKQVAFSYRV